MSLNVAEGNAACVIWSNEYLDWEEWKDSFEVLYGEWTQQQKFELMNDLNDDFLCDERVNLDVEVGAPIVVIADIGRWDGRHTGYREIESGNLKDCLYSELDGLTWYVDKQGDFRLDGYHHDGHNYYLYRKYRADITDEQREMFLDKILQHTLTKSDIDSVTERLGDDIARVYGFALPEPEKITKGRSYER